ncbi:MAG: hypothetical protein C4309_05750 [Chloroflexota bacterium]
MRTAVGRVTLFGIILLLMAWAGLVYAQGGDPQRGARLYAENCAMCHGPTGQGRVGPQLSKNFPGINVGAALKQIISNGVKGSVMPAWAQANGGPLSEQDINDITLFILSLKPQAGPTPTPAPTGGISGTTAFVILVAAVVMLIGGMLIFRPGRHS